MTERCYSDAELEAFLNGDLPLDLLDAVVAHLESCPTCEATTGSLEGRPDPVVVALRGGGTTVAQARKSLLLGVYGPTTEPSAPPSPPPSQVGSYEILGELGRGGMGVVYKARHVTLGRVVALKMLRDEPYSSADMRARFRREAEAVAQLQHPNIVSLFEAGEFEGRPYFTLEFVAGGSLETRQAGRPQPPRQAAAWVEALARAAHYAHTQGVVHRDLKPANILLADGRGTTADGTLVGLPVAVVPKIADFGIAKLRHHGAQTEANQVLGTPQFMAPEQAGAEAGVGPAADTYALGAILYTLLTGRPPFQAEKPLDTLLLVRTQDPVPPRRLNPGVPRDLETVCLKCLQKNPAKRYPSAAALSDDLRRYLDGKPILARPIGPLERTARWARRRPAVAGLLATIVLGTAVAFAFVSVLWGKAAERAVAESRARREIERLSAGILIDQAASFCEAGEVGRGLAAYARALELAVNLGDADLERVARTNLAGWRHHLVRPRGSFSHTGTDHFVFAVGLSPDGRFAVSGSLDGTVQILDPATGTPLRAPLVHKYGLHSVAISPDSKLILTGTGIRDGSAGEAKLWSLDTGLNVDLGITQSVSHVAFSPDGRWFLTVVGSRVQLWDARTRKPIGEPLPHAGVRATSFSPDGRLVLTAGGDGKVQFWDAATGTADGEPLVHPVAVNAASFTPDGTSVVTGGRNGTVQMWSVATRKTTSKPWRHRGPILAIAVSGDGKTVAASSMLMGVDLEKAQPNTSPTFEAGGEVRVWRDDKLLARPLTHPRAVRALDLSRDGRLLLTGCDDSFARFFAAETGTALGKSLFHEGTVRSVALSADGRTAITAAGVGGSSEWAARLWEPPQVPTTPTTLLPGERVAGLDLSSEGNALAAVVGGNVRVHDPDTGAARTDTNRPAGTVVLAFRTTGDTTAVASRDGRVVLVEKSGRVRWEAMHDGGATGLAYSSDGRFLYSVGEGVVREWRVDTGEGTAFPLPGADKKTKPIQSSDGRTVLYVDENRRVRPFDMVAKGDPAEWPKVGAFHRGGMGSSGTTAVTVGGDGYLRTVDATSGVPRGTPFGSGHLALTVSRDGRLAVSSNGGVAVLWDLATGKPLGAPLQHSEVVLSAAVAPDGKTVFTSSAHGISRWPTPAPLAGDAKRIRVWVEGLTGLTIDARGNVQELDETARAERRVELDRLGGAP